MNPKMALLILSWQVACLYHENEKEELLENSSSATKNESNTLDEIHDTLVPDVSWDEFNETYGNFTNMKDRVEACVLSLKDSSDEFKEQVLESMLKIANSSKENNNESNISKEEREFINQIRLALI